MKKHSCLSSGASRGKAWFSKYANGFHGVMQELKTRCVNQSATGNEIIPVAGLFPKRVEACDSLSREGENADTAVKLSVGQNFVQPRLQ